HDLKEDNIILPIAKGIEILLEKSEQVAQILSEQAMISSATTIKIDQQKFS
ncbi:17977_t:CDS:1, partial [Gigaspora margarita]